MRNIFSGQSGDTEGAERALDIWRVPYHHMPDGTLLVAGDLVLSSRSRKLLPDLTMVRVCGNFICFDNQLTSLKGVPQIVDGSFFCGHNLLTSLEHAPHSVGGYFGCSFNKLTSLQGAPAAVDGFDCAHNDLPSLEFAPVAFNELKSDFGTFKSRTSIPEHLLISPEKMIERQTVLQAPMQVGRALRLKSHRSFLT